jgi:hypothetical protein
MIMKKYLLYSLLGVAALSATSCNEDFNEDVAAPQQWEQEAAITLPTVTAKPVVSIDLATAGDSVKVFTTSDVTMPEGTTITNYRLEMTTETNHKAEIKADDNGKIATAELQTFIENSYGKRPTERLIWTNVYANLMKDGQASFLNLGSIEFKATPAAPQISKNYYLIGAPSQWDPLCVSMPFTHSGKDVYEDPIFTIVFPVADGETWFAVTDDITVEKNDWSQVFGCAEGNGNNGEEGTLKRRADLTDDGSFKVVVNGDAKFIKMTLNMMEYTYKIEKLNFAEFIYVPGNHQGWSPEKAPALQSPNFDGVYVGYTYLNGNFKFTKERNWNAEYNFNDFAVKDDIFFNNDGSNINISEEGFYQIKADVASSNLSAVKTTWGIIGPAQAGGWDTDTDMTWNAADESWTATVELAADEFKFRANDGWTINVGGSFDNLTQDGGNIKVTEAGTYEVKLFLTRSTSDKMYCTITKK